MANFNCTTLLGYNLRKEYIGSMNYRNVITLEVETLHETSVDPRYEIQKAGDYSYAEIYKKNLTPISLNGNGFGLGRVLSVSEPRSTDFQENGLTFWKRNLTIELYENGDDSNIPSHSNNTFYARLKNNLFNSRISEISETFNFNDGEDGAIGYTHTIDVTCVDEISDGSQNDNTKKGVYLARQIAQNLIESEVNFGFLGNLNNIYSSNSGKATYSVQSDVINGKVSITKTFSSNFLRTPASYSFSVDGDGYITISESITLKNQNLATKASHISDIILIMNNIKTGSYTRCNSYFNAYAAQIKTSENVDTLSSNNLISSQRSFDENSQQYTITNTFSNAKNIFQYYVSDIQQSLSVAQNGIVTISETGNLISRNFKSNGTDSPFLTSTIRGYIDSEQGGSKTRAENLFKSSFKTGTSPTLNLIRSSRVGSSNGKTFGYSCVYSNDKTILKKDGINKINTKIDVVEPIKKVASYIVPNKADKKTTIQVNDQSSLGTMTISKSAKLKRTDVNKTPDLVIRPTQQINLIYDSCLLSILNKLSSFGGDPTNFVTSSLSYSYNSNRDLEMSLSINFIVAAQRLGVNTIY